jgi:plasmid replication initiation protein
MTQEVPIEKMIVVKHNDLIDAAQYLSLYESRILLACISQIDSTSPIALDTKFSVSVTELADLVDVDGDGAYIRLKEAVERLYQREIIFLKPSKHIAEIRVRWVSRIEYLPNEGMITLMFSQDVTKLLSELTRNFTQYKLENVLRFKGCYTIRFYELICRWGGVTKTITIEQLKAHLGIENSYERWDRFKDSVIEPSVKDLNAGSNVVVSWIGVKRGRRMNAIKFTYKINKPILQIKENRVMSYTQKNTSTSNNFNHVSGIIGERMFGVLKSDIQKLALPGEDWFIAAQRIKKEQAELRKRGQSTLDIKW